VDSLVAAVALLDPPPDNITQAFLQRSTKRNVYSIIMVNTIRMLCGTFNWKLSQKPTSLDNIFNDARLQNALPNNKTTCKCLNASVFFTLDTSMFRPLCNGKSLFLNTASRISLVMAMQVTTIDLPAISPPITAIVRKHRSTERKRLRDNKEIKLTKLCTDERPAILKDITNVVHTRPLQDIIRPNDNELSSITQVNLMLSNFVITYFFTIMARSLNNILYKEFLLDLVQRDGGWKEFVANSKIEGHYASLFDTLQNKFSICIIPICHSHHWTILIRRFIGNGWKIFFLDSLDPGSDQRFLQWKTLFQDDDLFSGEWIKVKIIKQTKLECGARACLHGLCFALSNRSSASIMNNRNRISNLAARSRSMVSKICNEGKWQHQGWLQSIIGSQQA